jgi:hypothetical protein
MAVLALLVIVLCGQGNAQPGRQGRHEPDPKMKAAIEELRKDVRDYLEKNVLPEMRSWKTKLESAMSADDLKKLNGLREEAKTLRHEVMGNRRDMQGAWKDEDYARLKQERSEARDFGEDRREIITDLKPLAVKYESTLKEIGETAQSRLAAWKEEGKKIADKWLEKYEKDLPQARRALGRMHSLMDLGRFGLDSASRRKAAAARFMLWDGTMPEFPDAQGGPGWMGPGQGRMRPDGPMGPDAPMPPGGPMDERGNAGRGRQMVGMPAMDAFSISSHPNPFSSTTTINYTLKDDESVKMYVNDAKGKRVATLVDAMMPRGMHSVMFDGSDLPSGTYTVELKAESGSLIYKIQHEK